jgi:hypothetical protein
MLDALLRPIIVIARLAPSRALADAAAVSSALGVLPIRPGGRNSGASEPISGNLADQAGGVMERRVRDLVARLH